MAIILHFAHHCGRYSPNDIATWETADDFVKLALTPVTRYRNGQVYAKTPAAKVVTREEADRIVGEQRAVGERARDKRTNDPGLDLVYLTDHGNHHTGDVVSLKTDAAGELLRLEAPYYSNGVQVGVGPIVRPASQREKNQDHRSRIEALIAEREEFPEPAE